MRLSRRNFLEAASQGIASTVVGIRSAKRVVAVIPQTPPSVPVALPSPIAFEKATFLINGPSPPNTRREQLVGGPGHEAGADGHKPELQQSKLRRVIERDP